MSVWRVNCFRLRLYTDRHCRLLRYLWRPGPFKCRRHSTWWWLEGHWIPTGPSGTDGPVVGPCSWVDRHFPCYQLSTQGSTSTPTGSSLKSNNGDNSLWQQVSTTDNSEPQQQIWTTDHPCCLAGSYRDSSTGNSAPPSMDTRTLWQPREWCSRLTGQRCCKTREDTPLPSFAHKGEGVHPW